MEMNINIWGDPKRNLILDNSAIVIGVSALNIVSIVYQRVQSKRDKFWDNSKEC